MVPARARKPLDKPGVENGVLQACRWLLAPLRHRQFFALAELNQAIALLLGELNDKPMAPPRTGSRRDLFEAVERAAPAVTDRRRSWSLEGLGDRQP